jgi:hypothetical protein
MAGMRRRAALRLIGGAPLVAGFGFRAAELEAAQAEAGKALAAAAQGQAYQPKFFREHEWRMVRLLVDLIIPKDERSGSATDAGVPEFMDFLMTDPMEDERSREGRQTAMRGGLAWIDAVCHRRFGKSFVDAGPEEHKALLDEIAFSKPGDEELEDEDDDDVRREPREQQLVHLRHGPSFFNSFRDLTASGFWSSQLGVKDLGYIGNTAWLWEGPPPEVLKKLGIEE